MSFLRKLNSPFLILMAGGLLACSQQPAGSTAKPSTGPESVASGSPPGSPTGAPGQESQAQSEETDEHAGEAHQDHNSKHGGTFFMALNNKNHLEGVLDPPGVFRVFLYDDHTRPVSRELLDQAQMTVIWGERDGAPEIDLKPSKDGTVLEAEAPGPMHFPLTLTLLAHFPGAAASESPELFTFPFSHYSHPPGTPPHTHPAGP